MNDTENKSRVRRWAREHRTEIWVTILILLFLFVYLWPSIFIIIPPGHAGVIYRPFLGGTVVDRVFGEGLWVLFPFNQMDVYDIRVQETKRQLPVLTQEGLDVVLDLSIRYHPDIAMLGLLHQGVGPEYVEKVVVPEVFSAIRHQVGNRTAEELYTGHAAELLTMRGVVETPGARPPVPPGTIAAPVSISEVAPVTPLNPNTGREATTAQNLTLAEAVEASADHVSRKFVVIDAVILTRATLPPAIVKAVEKKIQEKQYAESQVFRLRAAEAEVDIKRREAEANTVLAASLTPDLLQLKGIEATRELAKSPNGKVVVIGSGPNGLPVILGGPGSP